LHEAARRVPAVVPERHPQDVAVRHLRHLGLEGRFCMVVSLVFLLYAENRTSILYSAGGGGFAIATHGVIVYLMMMNCVFTQHTTLGLRGILPILFSKSWKIILFKCALEAQFKKN
jgi:hypothetical protein